MFSAFYHRGGTFIVFRNGYHRIHRFHIRPGKHRFIAIVGRFNGQVKPGGHFPGFAFVFIAHGDDFEFIRQPGEGRGMEPLQRQSQTDDADFYSFHLNTPFHNFFITAL
jgi:hypothetical protein